MPLRPTRRSTRCLTAALAVIFGCLFALPGCGNAPTEDTSADKASGGGYTIASTIGMVSDLVTQVAGDRATVNNIIGTGVDPHLYSPTRSDVSKLMEADVIFYNGLLLEGKMTDTLIRAGTAGKKVFAVTELLDSEFLLDDEEGLNDPHVWMDPTAWAKAVEVIRDKLTEYDPAGAEVYTANAAAAIAKLTALDTYAETVLTSVPESSRVLITAHDAFNYFGQRFGYEVMGIQGLSTESEAGVRDIERMVSLLVKRDIKAVFVESTVSQDNIKALIEGAKAQGHTVTIGGELFSDAMGEPGTYEGTYVGMIDHNVTTIAKALGGKVPDGGMQHKLSDPHLHDH
ncbi:MAG: zinc ABC transporter substrate-binding protein [Planctomycetota bacterium]